MIEPSLIQAIHTHNHILCISHVNPDGDAYGSLLGMGWILHHLGKQVVLAMHDQTSKEFQLLPGAHQIIAPNAVADHYDLIVFLDASSRDRVGSVYQENRHQGIPVAVIDHHVTNTYFGDINWVRPDCAATCQMLVYLADALQVPLTGALAECLLTGIVTDTLCFRTSNTTAEVLEAAMHLIRGGADLATITQRTLNQRSLGVLKLWGMVLSELHFEEGVIWALISREQLKTAGDLSGDGQLSSMLITALEADISATFTEKIDEKGLSAVECSFRAKPGFNVATVALELGGGGHPAASGCTLPGTLAEVTTKVLPALKQVRAIYANQ
ncbi:MAG: bifunctional oligoribonuclease/PAP phosphatase NrnA [Chloroflexi bacterium]|nr:bifunctional oligoribonuclease/PAP phosphatase NrnA [Chloroflexota bacterium]